MNFPRAELGRSPAAVALAWAIAQPCITSAIMGATSERPLDDDLGAAELTLDAAPPRRLDAIFAPPRRAWWKRLLRRG